ncbi:MAG: EAL domain-containing protein, partial [Gemmatimonadetes bacterium]|nr:EAL domain-containing protein [Gemmatimonadota bacterium]
MSTSRPLHGYTVLPTAEGVRTLRESEAYFRSLVENARDVIHVINGDGTTRYITPSVRHLLGYTPEELIGQMALDLVHPDDRETAMAALRLDRYAPGAGRGLEFRVGHRDGSWRIFEGVGTNLMDDPTVQGVIVNSRDVTERKLAEEGSARLAAFPRATPSPILECDAAGAILYANPAAERTMRELGVELAHRLLPEDHAAIVRRALDSGVGVRGVEVGVNGRVLAWLYNPQPELGTVHLFGEDVTERKQAEARLFQEAMHDALTGLPNRPFFMQRLTAALVRHRRGETAPPGVLFLDLDRFKVVNDSLGHHVGDELLVAVAGRLRGCVRETDTVARFGGDEFAVLLEELDDPGYATQVAERIAAAVAGPVNLSGYEVFTGASIGIALGDEGHDRPEYLLRNADMAMYRAKANGAARYEVFDRAMHARALARLQMETDLRRALARGEFILHYQPIVALSTGRIIGVEALCRWQHPEQGLIPPGDFIGTAEETGVIVPLGDWVLEEACTRLAEWRREFAHARIAMSVNLSARQFAHGGLIPHILRTLARTGLDARHLKLELTESVLMEGGGATAAMLQELSSLGIELQLDDFGTGYSSLAYLHRFPIAALKIDRSFVSRMQPENPTTQLVRSIAGMARGLSLAVTAEGVETADQLDRVREMGCDFAQGFLISPPLPAEEFRALLAS